jgi:uncharacterized protein with FMN-binding domain
MPEKWMLGSGVQKILKFIHITAAAICLGGLFSMFAVILLEQHTRANQNPYLIDLIIYHIFNNVVNIAFYGILITAFIYALFTNWGFFKYRWITTKWIGVTLLFVFVWFWMGPTINGLVSLADGGFKLPGTNAEYFQYTQQSRIFILTEGLVFLMMIILSIFKPWGKRKLPLKINRKLQIGIVATILTIVLASLAMMTVTVRQYRNMKILDSDLANLADGKYHGKAAFSGFTYEVEATILNYTITDLQIIKNRTSSYARFAEGVIPRIIEKQNANVDVITGATTTSKALMKAVEDALTVR